MDSNKLEEGLMGEDYFISPRYVCKYTNDGGMFQKNTPTIYDEEDTLEPWLLNNSINFGHIMGDHTPDEHYSERRLFSGFNGVLCELKDVMIREEENMPRGETGYIGYSRMIRVRYMPINKEIPTELKDKLEELGYGNSLEKDSELLRTAKKLFGERV